MKVITRAAQAALLAWAAGASAQQGAADFPAPVDPESWMLPEWMVWEDYNPIPGVDWNAPSMQAASVTMTSCSVAAMAPMANDSRKRKAM